MVRLGWLLLDGCRCKLVMMTVMLWMDGRCSALLAAIAITKFTLFGCLGGQEVVRATSELPGTLPQSQAPPEWANTGT